MQIIAVERQQKPKSQKHKNKKNYEKLLRKTKNNSAWGQSTELGKNIDNNCLFCWEAKKKTFQLRESKRKCEPEIPCKGK